MACKKKTGKKKADVAYFGGDWRNARGCKIEHEIAKEYGIDRIED